MKEKKFFDYVLDDVMKEVKKGSKLAELDLLVLSLGKPTNKNMVYENFVKLKEAYQKVLDNNELQDLYWLNMLLLDSLDFKEEFPLIGYYVEMAIQIEESKGPDEVLIAFSEDIFKDLYDGKLNPLDYKTMAELRKKGMERIQTTLGSSAYYPKSYFGETEEEFWDFFKAA